MAIISAYTIEPALARDIEDAILLGHIGEIDSVLVRIEDESDFPAPLRSGLEALRHFRAHYGKGSAFQPEDELQKKKMSLMESAWGAELLDMLRHNEAYVARQA
ncbi:MAG: hypothetical protein M3N08_10485 [Pseudomonadota bacterium]|nr:hypothetical protein [Pseudomonadota bacterium]